MIVLLAEVEPPGPVTVRVTVYVPALYMIGPRVNGTEPEIVSPLPRFHTQDVILPVEVSVSCTASGAKPKLGTAVNDAVMVCVPTDGVLELTEAPVPSDPPGTALHWMAPPTDRHAA